MYLSREWLSEWFAPDVELVALEDRLTMAGLEVDGVTRHTATWSGVVVAQIKSLAQHPQADRLRLCEVDTGDGQPLQIVCGAPNVYEGMYAPLATVGAQLNAPQKVKIKKSKIRGVESHGMLCSAAELGLGDDASGLLDLGRVPLGTPLEDVVTEDTIYKLDLTPNRGDCFSLKGVARDLSVLYGASIQSPQHQAIEPQHSEQFSATVEVAEACPVYLTRTITGVDSSASAPAQIRDRLRRCGMRSVHPVVDVLNYLMLELGQPMHAFDKAKLTGHLVVRLARNGEKMVTIDGSELTLTDRDLVIADDDRVQALAGIVGSEHSAVSSDTQDVVVECAFFNPRSINGRARVHGLHTESSLRFERGVDSALQHQAIQQATSLILESAGGACGPVAELCSAKHLPQRSSITLSTEHLSQRLGIDIPEAEIEQTLSALGCETKMDKGAILCTPPSWRFDLEIEEDLIEEVGRIYGYDELPEELDIALSSYPQKEQDYIRNQALRDRMLSSGYHEASTYSFTNAATFKMFTDEQPVVVQNPISEEMSHMVASLWSGLLPAMSYNLRRQFDRVRLFQIAKVFRLRNNAVAETLSLAGVACGDVLPEQWKNNDGPSDFYSIKGDVEKLLAAYPGLHFVASEHKALQPGQCADIFVGEARIGHIGQLMPSLLKQCKINMPVMGFEIDLDALPSLQTRRYTPVSSYPSTRVDLAVILPAEKRVDELLSCIDACQPVALRKISIFDIFTGQNIDSGHKSVGVGLIFQADDKTLTKAEVDNEVSKIVEAITQFGGSLRE